MVKTKTPEGFTEVGMTPAWDPDSEGKGAEIRGILKEVESKVGPNKSNLYTFRTEDGFVGVWGSTVLDIRLKNVELGDEVVIRYLGEVESLKRKGSMYKNYQVFHKHIESTEEEPVDLDEVTEEIK